MTIMYILCVYIYKRADPLIHFALQSVALGARRHTSRLKGAVKVLLADEPGVFRCPIFAGHFNLIRGDRRQLCCTLYSGIVGLFVFFQFFFCLFMFHPAHQTSTASAVHSGSQGGRR